MKDAVGNELNEGDLVFVQLTNPVLRARVLAVREGGMRIPLNPTQAASTADTLEVAFKFDLTLADAQPGQKHPIIHRIPDPESEIIMKKKDMV